MIDGGKTLEVEFAVEDPGAFTMPWSGKQRYNRADKRPLIETICADNLAHYFAYEIPPSPVAGKPDF